MSDTRVITAEFDCVVAATVAEATAALQQEAARVLAGGTDLLNLIKTNLLRPRLLVYPLKIEELAAMRWQEGLEIGAAVRLSAIEHDPRVAESYPALVEAVNVIGGVQIRNMATLAGNLCNASPGADTPPVLLVLGAEVEIAGPAGGGDAAGGDGASRDAAGGHGTRKRLPLQGFFSGPKRTVLGAGEMLTAVRLPEPAASSGAAFRRLARVSLDIAKINCAAWLRRDGERIAEARVALGSVAPTPVRCPTLEAALAGQKGNEELFRKAAGLIREDIAPITDVRSTEGYRREVAAVLVRDALEQAWQRAGGR